MCCSMSQYYFSHPIEILKIWKGGLASHGGTVGVLLAILLFVRQHPENRILWLLDRLAIPTALTACCIRLGNFMNSGIIGLPTGSDWGVIFERVDQLPRRTTVRSGLLSADLHRAAGDVPLEEGAT